MCPTDIEKNIGEKIVKAGKKKPLPQTQEKYVDDIYDSSYSH